VAAEMVSGDLGLGYLIVDAYMNNVTVPMVIAMITLGFIGYFSSACVRTLGNKLMAWHVKELAQQGR
jgi:NitT/TauT family transport system permease protein